MQAKSATHCGRASGACFDGGLSSPEIRGPRSCIRRPERRQKTGRHDGEAMSDGPSEIRGVAGPGVSRLNEWDTRTTLILTLRSSRRRSK